MRVQPLRPLRQVSVAKRPLSLAKSLFLIVVLVFSFLLAFPSALVGLLLWFRALTLHDAREWTRGTAAAAIFGLLAYGGWIWLADPLPWLWSVLIFDLVHRLWTPFQHTGLLLWAFNLWLAPTCGVLYTALTPRYRQASRDASGRPKDVHVEDEGREQRQVTQNLVQFGLMLAGQPRVASFEDLPGSVAAHSPALSSLVVPQVQPHYEILGSYIQGELDSWVFGGELCVPPEWLELHGVLVGEPKYGKTWTLLRLAVIARLYGRRVIYLDMKGSRKTAALFLAAMSMLNVQRMKIFPLEAYDGWRGTPKALFNRLMEQVDPRTHPFYRSGVGSSLLSLAVNAPVGMPKNSYELLERLSSDWLSAAYSTDVQAMREISALVPHIDGFQLVMAGFFRGIAGGLDGQWAYDDVDACYIGVDSVTHKEEAALMGRYLLDDAADFATARKPEDDQVLFIIDEFGGLRSTNATGLYEKIREAGMSVYASSQSYQSLGVERDSLLAASSIKILHRTGSPKPILDYAGERERVTYMRMMGSAENDEELFHPLANRAQDPEATNRTMMRSQKELAVPVEDVQQLKLGQIAVISGGKGGFAQVYPLALPQQRIEAAARFIANTSQFKPLPSPTLPPPAPKPLKKKIAAISNAPMQGGASAPNKAAPTTNRKPAPVPATTQAVQPISPRKQPFPQNGGGQGLQQSQGPTPPLVWRPTLPPIPIKAQLAPQQSTPSVSPTVPANTAGQGGQKKSGDDDDDVIDFFN